MDNYSYLSRISEREKEVVELIAQGFTTTQIGQELHIASTTVISHRNNLREKLKCKNCPQLIYKASKIGLI
jgi:DNA-binding CsgD family transcriptional regulator